MKISQMIFNLQSRQEYMVEMAIFIVQRVITPKKGKPELQFMCSVHHFMVPYISVTFSKNISNSISSGADKKL